MQDRTEKLFGKGNVKLSLYVLSEFKNALESLAEKSRYRSLNRYCIRLLVDGVEKEIEKSKPITFPIVKNVA